MDTSNERSIYLLPNIFKVNKREINEQVKAFLSIKNVIESYLLGK